jgi:hypothetical protein
MSLTAALLSGTADAKNGLETIYQSPASGDYLIGTHANADGSVFVVSSLGPNNDGAITLLTPNKKSYVPTLIKAFACDIDGGHPSEALVADAAGNVWGMGNGCGGDPDADPQGTLFELVKPQSGGQWTFKTVAQMPKSIGNLDIFGSGYRSVVFDKAGNLYGLATLGCVEEDGCGKIFKAPAALLDGTQPKKKIKILYEFPYAPGDQPNGMVRDKAGNLFGVEYSGGSQSLGSVWEVSPPTSKNGAWTSRNIHEFCLTQNSGSCDDGYGPAGVPALDGKGDLFGTTLSDGGSHTGNGTVWTLVPPSGGSDWTFGEVHVFRNPQGSCQATTDYGLFNPKFNTLLDKKGQILTFMGSGGFFAPCSNSQSTIYGALVSASPVSDGDAIVSNQFAVQNHVSGPYTIFSSPSLMGNTVFGTSSEYYDTATDTYSAGVVFKITE